MRLEVSSPIQTVLDIEVVAVVGPGQHGRFGIRSGHADFVAILEPGLLAYDVEASDRRYMAVDGGVLVKRGADILVSTRDGFVGPDLEALERTIEEQYRHLTLRERRSREALERLEIGLMRHLTNRKRT